MSDKLKTSIEMKPVGATKAQLVADAQAKRDAYQKKYKETVEKYRQKLLKNQAAREEISRQALISMHQQHLTSITSKAQAATAPSNTKPATIKPAK